MKGQAHRNLEVELIEGVAIIRFLDRKLLQAFGENDDVLRVREQLYSLVEDGHFTRLVLDFGTVEYMSTIMLGVLVRLKSKVESAGGRLTICRLDPHVREAFRVTKLDRIFAIFRDEHAALATF